MAAVLRNLRQVYRLADPNIQWSKRISDYVYRVGLKKEFIEKNPNIYKFKIIEHEGVLMNDPICELFINKNTFANSRYICSPTMGYISTQNISLLNNPEKLYEKIDGDDNELNYWLFEINMLNQNTGNTYTFTPTSKMLYNNITLR